MLERTMYLTCYHIVVSAVSISKSLIYWRRGVVVITTAQLHSTKPELRFCAGSSPARAVTEIHDGKDL